MPEDPSSATQENSQESSFGDILSQFEQAHHTDFRAGETVQGTVVTKSPENLYIDVGRKIEGLLPLAKALEAGLDDPKPGDIIKVMVTGRDSPKSLYSNALVTFEDDKGAYDQKDAEGFIRLNALRLRTLAMRDKQGK